MNLELLLIYKVVSFSIAALKVSVALLHLCVIISNIFCACVCLCGQSLQVAQKEAQIRLLEGQLRQTDVIGSSHNHMILDALREKAEYIPELQALIHNVQQGEEWSLSFSFPAPVCVDSPVCTVLHAQ